MATFNSLPSNLVRSSAMPLELYQEVALTRDLPEHQLRKGDIVTLIDRIPHPSAGEPGCVLEVLNAIGESIAIISLRLLPSVPTKFSRCVLYPKPVSLSISRSQGATPPRHSKKDHAT
jgi:hypothetical protein